jgi:bifunctional enzyme CysN/CysC
VNVFIVGGQRRTIHPSFGKGNPMAQRSRNITKVEHRITGASRTARSGHVGGVLWLTGLSGAGKTTLAFKLEELLFNQGYQVYVLDGDNVRYGLSADLGFSPEDRAENVRRVGEVAALFADAGLICISAFISPYRQDREVARRAAGKAFHEVYVKASVAVCEQRDPKGLYRKARAGELKEFTGISAPYEAPVDPELILDTEAATVPESLGALVRYVETNFCVGASPQAVRVRNRAPGEARDDGFAAPLPGSQ